MAPERGKAAARTVALGIGSVVLYLVLYLMADRMVAWSAQGRWMFVLPVGIAFLFSMVHGAFTGHFWDVLGFKAKR
jgi:hypothetical protein